MISISPDCNFVFLEEGYSHLAQNACIAESCLYTDPHNSIIKIGVVNEELCRIISVKSDIELPKPYSFRKVVYNLKKYFFTDEDAETCLKIEEIAKSRNQAAHNLPRSEEAYRECMEVAIGMLYAGFIVSKNFYCRFINQNFPYPDFHLSDKNEKERQAQEAKLPETQAQTVILDKVQRNMIDRGPFLEKRVIERKKFWKEQERGLDRLEAAQEKLWEEQEKMFERLEVEQEHLWDEQEKLFDRIERENNEFWDQQERHLESWRAEESKSMTKKIAASAGLAGAAIGAPLLFIPGIGMLAHGLIGWGGAVLKGASVAGGALGTAISATAMAGKAAGIFPDSLNRYFKTLEPSKVDKLFEKG